MPWPNGRNGWKAIIAERDYDCHHCFMRFIFNPALLDFLVILAVLNVAANVLFQLGAFGPDYLVRASQATAGGFIVALIYTASRDRPGRR